MSASRRVLPVAPSRRGWCPGLARPMPTGDGLLARIHPPLGILTVAQVRAVAEAATRFGNGHVDITARANLQLRGVTDGTRSRLVAALENAGLGDTRTDGGPQRLTLTSPLAGLSPALLDVPTLARAIEAQGLTIAGLPAKTLVLIEGGGATDLPGIPADISVRASTSGKAALGIADGDGIAWIATCPESQAATAVASLLRAFAAAGRRRVRDLEPNERVVLAQAFSDHAIHDAVERDRPRTVIDGYPDAFDAGSRLAPSGPLSRSGEGTRATFGNFETPLALEAPFGRCTAAMLERLAEVAVALGTDEIRLSPARGFVLPAGRAPAARRSDRLADLSAAGFVTEPDDPRRAVAACPGAPACASGSTATGADAARLAEAFRPFAAGGMTGHVSGCAKGCAHPGHADLTLVGREGRYGVVVGGMPGDVPALELTFEAALERVRRAPPGTLAEAFGLSPVGRQARAEPAFGTTI